MSETKYTAVKIDECLKIIEKKLEWGSSKSWNTSDFEKLSELIMTKTGVLISITTLKRIWGRIKYDSSPNSKTLDALTQFAELGTWRNFTNKKNNKIKRTKANTGTRILESDGTLRWVLIFFTSLCISIFYLSSLKNEKNKGITNEYKFSSRVISKGLPNSVVFDYDARYAQTSDLIELQQSWDASKRMVLSRDKNVATSIYYTPGFFNAKLLVNDQIIKEHDIFIPTDGWLGIIEDNPEPIYLNKNEIRKEGEVGIWLSSLLSRDINPKLNRTWTSIYNVGAFKNITVDDFTIETSVRNNSGNATNACQFVEIVLYCEGEVILSRYSIPGCISQNKLIVLDKYVDGNAADLSSFGVDFSEWVELKWESKDNMLSFFINDKFVFETSLEGKKNMISGIKYRFQGTGSVQQLTLSGKEGLQIHLL